MKITYQQLVRNYACPGQMRLFSNIFGDGVKITEEICKEYYNVFNFEWVVKNLFPFELRNKYYQDLDPFYDKYRQDLKSIRVKYIQDCDSLKNKYKQDRKLIEDKYYQDLKAIENKYYQDLKAIEDKYLYDCVLIFYKYSLTIN